MYIRLFFFTNIYLVNHLVISLKTFQYVSETRKLLPSIYQSRSAKRFSNKKSLYTEDLKSEKDSSTIKIIDMNRGDKILSVKKLIKDNSFFEFYNSDDNDFNLDDVIIKLPRLPIPQSVKDMSDSLGILYLKKELRVSEDSLSRMIINCPGIVYLKVWINMNTVVLSIYKK